MGQECRKRVRSAVRSVRATSVTQLAIRAVESHEEFLG